MQEEHVNIQMPFEKASDRIGSFQSLVEHFARLAQKDGLTVTPYRGTGPSHFAALPDPLQIMILDIFRQYVSVCNSAIEEGWSLRQEGHVLWRMFNKLGVHPSSDLMDKIETDDIIEIYGPDFVQVFRNLKFFQYCGYTLDDLLARPFWELYKREEKVTNEYLAVGAEMFSGRKTGIHSWDIGTHVIEEIDSVIRAKSIIEPKFVSPLCDSTGRVVALVHVTRCLSSIPGVVEAQ